LQYNCATKDYSMDATYCSFLTDLTNKFKRNVRDNTFRYFSSRTKFLIYNNNKTATNFLWQQCNFATEKWRILIKNPIKVIEANKVFIPFYLWPRLWSEGIEFNKLRIYRKWFIRKYVFFMIKNFRLKKKRDLFSK